MEIEQILSQVETLVTEARPSLGVRYHVCWWNEKIAFLPANHNITPHPVFFCATGQHFIEGLTDQEWDNLLYKIIIFEKGLRQCQNHPKQSPTSKPKS